MEVKGRGGQLLMSELLGMGRVGGAGGKGEGGRKRRLVRER